MPSNQEARRTDCLRDINFFNCLLIFLIFIVDLQVLNDVKRIVGDPDYFPIDPKELCNRIFVTCYMGSENSSQQTKTNAKNLSQEIGRYEKFC